MVKTGSVYGPSKDDDGLRVLVTRYWPRGVKKQRVDLWIRGLSPAPGLIKAWKSGSIGWDEFRSRYLAEFEEPEKKGLLAGLRETARSHKVITLLCACREGMECHRGLLSSMLRGGS